MQIHGLGGAVIPGNNSVQALGETADQANFAAMLEESRKKVEGVTKADDPTPQDAELPPNAKAAAQKVAEQEKLRQVCKDFEAMFINLMYREMRNSVPKNELFGHSNAIEIFEDMRDTELTKHTANAGGIGIADLMYRQLSLTLDPKAHVRRAPGALPMMLGEGKRKEVDP